MYCLALFFSSWIQKIDFLSFYIAKFYYSHFVSEVENWELFFFLAFIEINSIYEVNNHHKSQWQQFKCGVRDATYFQGFTTKYIAKLIEEIVTKRSSFEAYHWVLPSAFSSFEELFFSQFLLLHFSVYWYTGSSLVNLVLNFKTCVTLLFSPLN